MEDSASLAIAVIFYFIIPSGLQFFNYCRKRKVVPRGETKSLMTWIFVVKRTPWGLILLIGAGMAINHGMKKSGLAQQICDVFKSMENWPFEAQILVVIILTALFSQAFVSAAAVPTNMSILMPLAQNLDVHPLRLCLPSTLVASGAYLLPVSGSSLSMVSSLIRIKPQKLFVIGLFPWALNICYVYIHAISWIRVIYPHYIRYPPGLKTNMEHYEGDQQFVNNTSVS